jgi:hypothetical protein
MDLPISPFQTMYLLQTPYSGESITVWMDSKCLVSGLDLSPKFSWHWWWCNSEMQDIWNLMTLWVPMSQTFTWGTCSLNPREGSHF